ncbi:MAG: hypothetical protein R3D52_13670 [Xanthobacteraceae bacterium]
MNKLATGLLATSFVLGTFGIEPASANALLQLALSGGAMAGTEAIKQFGAGAGTEALKLTKCLIVDCRGPSTTSACKSFSECARTPRPYDRSGGVAHVATQGAPAAGNSTSRSAVSDHPDTQFIEGMKRLTKTTGGGEEAEGLRRLRQAAEQGHDKAALVLAVRQSTGRGMAPDDSAAYVWAKRAEATARANETREAAAKLGARVAKRLDVKQLAAAEQQFADWVLQRELAAPGKVEPESYKNRIVARSSPEGRVPKTSRAKKTARRKVARSAQSARLSTKHRRVHSGSHGRRSISYSGSDVTVRIRMSGDLRRLAESWGR